MDPAQTPQGDFWSLPIHPIFVHFPIAMLTIAWLLIVLGHLTGIGRWTGLARSIEWIGIAFLPLTLLSGLRDAAGLDLATDLRWDQPLLWHILFGSAAAVAFVAHAVWRYHADHRGRASVRLDVSLSSIGFWLLMMSGLVAGEMVYGQ